jgi:hypothetical protein
MNLDVYGGAYRCLLRLREDAGNPVMSDRAFEAGYLTNETLPKGPVMWSTAAIGKMADALGLPPKARLCERYNEVLANHRAGLAVLVSLKASSFSLQSSGEVDYRVTVLSDMDDREFSVWCPLRNETWERLSSIDCARWESINAVGITLYPRSRPPAR